MPQRYVSNKNESVRMFESDFMELFSHVHPVTPLVIYLPVIGYMLHLAIAQRGLSIGAAAGLFALGLVIWTLVEYTMHRCVFHYEPRSGWGKKLHFLVHGVHHDYPQDASRLVMPPVISIPLALIFYGLFLGVFGSLAPARLCRSALWVSLLRHDSLRDASSLDEERRRALAEAISHASSLQRRPCRLRRQLAAVGLRFPDEDAASSDAESREVQIVRSAPMNARSD